MRTRSMLAMTLIAFAGAAVTPATLLAQGGTQNNTPTRQPTTISAARQAHYFLTFSDLNGKDVVNSTGDKLASISDLAVDRGNGRIEYVIISEGGFLGIGDQQIAIPFDEFNYDSVESRLVLNTPKEVFERDRGARPAGWVTLESGEWRDTLSQHDLQNSRNHRYTDNDPYARGMNDATNAQITGTILSIQRERAKNIQGGNQNLDRNLNDPNNPARDRDIDRNRDTDRDATRDQDRREQERRDQDRRDQDQRDRDRTQPERDLNRNPRDMDGTRNPGVDNFNRDGWGADTGKAYNPYAENVVATIRTDDNEIQRVVLGPAWYVMGQDNMPMRGQKVTINGYQHSDDSGRSVVARSVTIDGKPVRYRDDTGRGAWTGNLNPTDRTNPGTGRLVMLSEVVGMDVRAIGGDGGEIDGAVVEMSSGSVPMLILDPNENFLGIGDTRRLVPWSVVGIGREAVWIDADKNMLTAGKELPDDVQVFAQQAQLDPVYRAYNVESPHLQNRYRKYDRNHNTNPNDPNYDRNDPNNRNNPADRDRGRNPGANADDLGGWSRSGQLVQAVSGGERVTVKGKVASAVREIEVPGTDVKASAVDVKTERGKVTVVLGPAWYVNDQSARLQENDTVTIDARSADFNGSSLRVAQSIQTDSGRTITLWRDGMPSWDAS